MASNTSQPDANSGAKTKLPPPNVVLPQFTSTVEQNVKPVVTEAQRIINSTVEQNVMPVMTEAQRIAAQTAYSGRKAVSRGTIFLAFYLWLLSGAIMLSLIARYTDFFPGDMSITKTLQKRRSPLVRRFMVGISEIGFAKIAVPLTVSIAGILWALRFRLEAVFILLTTSSNVLNALVKRLIKRPRPANQLV